MQYEIPLTPSSPLRIELGPGETLYITGANGSGKSALLLELLAQSGDSPTRWLSARRQVHLSALAGSSGIMNYVNLDYRRDDEDRQNIFENKLVPQFLTEGRWQEQEAEDRLTKPLYELVTRENARARTIADSIDRVNGKADNEFPTPPPSPLHSINRVLSQSGLKVSLSMGNDGKLLAINQEGISYDIAQASDGERGAVVAAATVITAPENSVILIDEPDRHLHRSVIAPFMAALADLRKDCSFIIATYETALPDSDRNARVLVVKSSTWSDGKPSAWDIDEIQPGESLPEEVRSAILGSRSRIIFVEGNEGSLDYRLYSALFPNAVIKGIGGYGDVEGAVRSLRQNVEHTRIEAVGIIDGDGRPEESWAANGHAGIHVLRVFCVECLYYCEDSLAAVARFRSPVLRRDPEELVSELKDSVLDRLASGDVPEQLAARRAWSQVRANLSAQLPTPEEIRKSNNSTLKLEVSSPFLEEAAHYRQLLDRKDLGELIARYPVHQSQALDPVQRVLRLINRADYADTVLHMVRSDPDLANQLRNRMGRWAEDIAASI